VHRLAVHVLGILAGPDLKAETFAPRGHTVVFLKGKTLGSW
jgi:hypothetical protein